MPSATSYYSQKTVTTKTTTTKNLPKYEIRLQQQKGVTAPIPEPRSLKTASAHYDSSSSRGAADNQTVVFDTLRALAKDCNETAEILRSRSSSRSNLVDDGRQSRLIYNLRQEETRTVSPRPTNTDLVSECYEKAATRTPRRSASPALPVQADQYAYRASKHMIESEKALPTTQPKPRPLQQEIEYTLRLESPIQRCETPTEFSPRQKYTLHDRTPSLEKVCHDFNLDAPRPRSTSRPRSETPTSRRMIVLDHDKETEAPICAACNHHIYGPCITALAPNSKRGAQKYHPHHFVCSYCLKPLNLKGTYREQDSKPYCHECFYRLFSGHVYVTENKISLDV